jgi:hypothetical protein
MRIDYHNICVKFGKLGRPERNMIVSQNEPNFPNRHVPKEFELTIKAKGWNSAEFSKYFEKARPWTSAEDPIIFSSRKTCPGLGTVEHPN